VTTQAQLDMNFLAYVREDIADGDRGKFYTVEFVADIMAAVDRVIAERDEARRHACEQRRILPAPWAMEPKDFAFTMGWDLYDKKEDGK
jgi:hypothetical protein